jgi:hypothetical protein
MTCLKSNTCDIAMKLTTADREDRHAIVTAQEWIRAFCCGRTWRTDVLTVLFDEAFRDSSAHRYSHCSLRAAGC